MAKKTSAVTVADMKSSETNATVITTASVGSRRRKTSPSRARPIGSCSPASTSRRLGRTTAATPATTRNVAAFTSMASRIPPAAARTPPTNGPTVKPMYRAVSTRPLATASRASPATPGTSANSAGCESANADPSSAARIKTGNGPRHEGERDREHRLDERADEQHPPRADSVGEQPCRACQHDRGRPDGDEEECHHDTRSRRLLDVQGQGDEREEVAERREPDGPDEEVEVSAPAGHSASQTTLPSRLVTRPIPPCG